MTSTIIGNIWVCQCCALIHANGECCAEDSHGGDGREPWSAVGDDVDITAGLLWEEHGEECSNRLANEWVDECDCETHEFAWGACEGCGSSLGGSRYAHTLWTKESK